MMGTKESVKLGFWVIGMMGAKRWNKMNKNAGLIAYLFWITVGLIIGLFLAKIFFG